MKEAQEIISKWGEKNMPEYPKDKEGKFFENQDNKGKKKLKKRCKKGGKVNQAIRSW